MGAMRLSGECKKHRAHAFHKPGPLLGFANAVTPPAGAPLPAAHAAAMVAAGVPQGKVDWCVC